MSASKIKEIKLAPVTVLPYVLFRYEPSNFGDPFAFQVIGFYGGYFEAMDAMAALANDDFVHGYDVLNLTGVVKDEGDKLRRTENITRGLL